MRLQIKILLLFAISGCQSTSNSTNDLIIPDEVEENKNLSFLTAEVQFSPLFGADYLLPHEADKVSISDQLIVIGDFTFSKSLYVFEKQTGQAVEIPLKKGEGPMEVREVSDFWLTDDQLFVLDALGRKIIPMRYSQNNFELAEPIILKIPMKRFAKTQTGFVGLTGGGQDHAVAFVDHQGKILSTHFPMNISFLMSPMNPFLQFAGNGVGQVWFHSPFDPNIYRMDEGQVGGNFAFHYRGEALTSPTKTDFRMDGDGFNSFRETLINQPSFFNLFERWSNQWILLYFLKNQPRIALVDQSEGYSFRLENLKNDVSFDQPFPKIIGVSALGFSALVVKDQINLSDHAFSRSLLEKAINKNPDAKLFMLEFQLKLE